jgi:hypothetical protein
MRLFSLTNQILIHHASIAATAENAALDVMAIVYLGSSHSGQRY